MKGNRIIVKTHSETGGDVNVYAGVGFPQDLVDGVLSVTGDGVDNTIPNSPVISFPTPNEIGADTSGEVDSKIDNAINALPPNGVETVTGDGVSGTAKDVIITFPTPLEIGALEPSDISDFETSAELNARDVENRKRENHTGTQLADTISDFDDEVSNNPDVVANTAKEGNATHTGDVEGDTVLTIVKGERIVTGALIELQEADKRNTIISNSLNDVSLVVPNGLPAGEYYKGFQIGNGKISFSGENGVKIQAGSGYENITNGKNSEWNLYALTPEKYILYGKLFERDTSLFITTWKVESGDTTITIPIGTGIFDYDVSWNNDGVWDEGKTGSSGHDYGVAGTYTVAIRGDFPSISFNNNTNRLKFMSVEQWGDIQWESLFGAFDGCENMMINTVDDPDLRNLELFNAMFRNAKVLNADINSWDTSNVISTASMFQGATAFNSNLDLWDVSNVSNMNSMFRDAIIFNQDLGDWNVSNVLNLSNFLRGVTLSTANYDALLIGWASRPVKPNLTFNGGNSKYSPSGKVGRDILLAAGWTINDSGPA